MTTTHTAPASMPAKVRLCADGCGQPITVGSHGRRFVPGHARTAARPINAADFAPADLEKFWKFVRPSGGLGCWEWGGPRDQQGYGRIWFGKRRDARKLLAHRVMWR